MPMGMPVSAGGLPLSGGTLTGSLTMSSGTLLVRADEDVVTDLGRVRLGYDGTNAAYATFAHFDNMTQLNMALQQGAAGATTLNAKSGQSVAISVNAVPSLTIAATTATFADLVNIAFATGTGTKIGTATTQKLAFYNAVPIAQGASVADASGGATIDAEARTAINALISRIEATGLIATV